MDRKEMTAEQLIESFNTEYYRDEIDEHKTMRDNIRMGRDENEGIRGYRRVSGKVYTGKEKEERIKYHDRAIKRLQDQAAELGRIIRELNSATNKLDTLAKDDVIMSEFSSMISTLSRHKADSNNSEKEFEHFTRTYELWKKHRKSHLILGDEDNRKKDKISKDMYKKLKHNQSLRVTKNGGTIKYEVGQSKFSMEGLLHSYFSEKRSYYHQHKGSLGFDLNRIERAKNILLGRSDYEFQPQMHYSDLDQSRSYLEHINALENQYHLYQFRELKSYCHEVIELARELYYVEEILAIFENTSAKKDEDYETLTEIQKMQEKRLNSLVEKMRKVAEKEEFDKICEAIDKLEELWRKLQARRHHLNSLQSERVKEQYYGETTDVFMETIDIEVEMRSILEKYPRLNRYEFGIDLNKKEKQEAPKPIERKPEERVDRPVQSEPVRPVVTEPEVKTEYKTPVVEPKGAVVEPVETVVEVSEPVKEEPIPTVVQSEKEHFEAIETPEAYQVHHIQYYQDYMREKLKNSPLGKIPFSEYLEKVAPNLTELIEVEKQREAQAKTLYKLYLRYLAQQPNKKTAMRFNEFVKFRYDLEYVDVPVEFEAEEEERKRK